jgi:hypothetical protein
MKSLILAALLLQITIASSFTQSDSSRHKLKAAATVTLNSNGFGAIPAFSLGDPAVIANISLTKGRLSYEPALAYGLDLKPWYIDNWLNFRIVNRSKFILITGLNANGFYTRRTISDTTILQVQRYFTFALTGLIKITANTTLTTAYWRDHGMDGGINGHFANLAVERTGIPLGGKNMLAVMLQVFYIDYEGNNDGLFVTPRITYSILNFPLSVFTLGTQPISSNIEPFPDFQWNVGLGYGF